MQDLLVLSIKDIQKLVSMRKCIELQEEAFRAVHLNQAVNAKNSWLYMDKHSGYIKLMGCYLEAIHGTETLMIKAIDAFEKNPSAHNLPVVLGCLTLFDCNTGLPICFMDGAYITALRTGAAGGLATKYLSVKDPQHVGVIGTGSTAGYTVRAILESVSTVKEVKIYSRNPDHRENLRKKLVHDYDITGHSVGLPTEAVEGADIIVTGTTSSTPVLTSDLVTRGQHINAMGIKTEIDPLVFKIGKIIADSKPIACSDGKTSVAIKAKAVQESDVYADLGELVCGKKPGRTSQEEITLFDSSGVAAQDAVLAAFVYEEARKRNVGQYVDVFGGISDLMMP